MKLNTEATFVSHLGSIEAEITEAWKAGDVDRLALVRKAIAMLDKKAGEFRATFDEYVDRRDDGTWGSDYCTPIVRMRKKNVRSEGKVRETADDFFANL